MELSDNAKRLMKKRYCKKGESPEDVFDRTANVIGKDRGLESEFKEIMKKRKFLPNSPTLWNSGGNNQCKACFVWNISDSIPSIFDAIRASALIFKSGGGVGYDFSDLREKGAPISDGGTSTGVISFMRIFDQITEAIKQGGKRRGASMGILKYDHPEILDFVKEKIQNGSMTNFNLSVRADDQFMENLNNDEVVSLKSRKDKRRVIKKIKLDDLFNVITYSAWLSGDPGMVFTDRVNDDNPYSERITCCNPCGEQFLYPKESCCLGSINLNTIIDEKGDINWNEFDRLIELGTKFLLSVNKINEFPDTLDGCYKKQYKYNRIGLGVMGFADLLIKLKIKYDSEDALDIIDKLGKRMKKRTKKLAPSSASTLSIAPTGSLSILADCSHSIEPIFDRSYTRHLTIGKIKESWEDTDYLRTAHEISPEWHVKIQAQWQRWIDNGVSKTINLKNTASLQDIKDIYYQAWDEGCKGVTVFRQGCKDGVLKADECDKGMCSL